MDYKYLVLKKIIRFRGTEAWFKYLNNKKRLLEIDLTKQYPIGTLLIQNFNEYDQGHVAVVIDSNQNVLESLIIHNVYGTWDNKTYNSTVTEKLIDYPYYSRFTMFVILKIGY